MDTPSTPWTTNTFRRGTYRGPQLDLSGETALLLPGLPGYVKAQFDDAPRVELNYGWHEFPESHFYIEVTGQ